MRRSYPCTLCEGRRPKFANRAQLREHEAEQHPLVESQTLESDREKRISSETLLREIHARTRLATRGPKLEDLAAAIGFAPNNVHLRLKRMVADGLVQQPGRGNGNAGYQLTALGLQRLEGR